MTFDEAVSIRAQQLQRRPVDPELVAEAMRVIRNDWKTAPTPLSWPEVEVVKPGYGLSPQQRAIFDLMLKGGSNSSVAAAMSINTGTVSQQMLRAKRKLGVATKQEAVEKWRRYRAEEGS
jgi:DNA-binding CsgD family transcriptional regulator